MEWTSYLLLFGIGCVSGALNVLAGGGSFLTLPVLMLFFGLPAGVANGTNRVGILLQNISAVWGFTRHGVMDRSAWIWAMLPATAGGIVGAIAAQQVSDQMFKDILAVLMVVLSLWSLWRPGKRDPTRKVAPSRWIGVGFFAVGVYGGFVQAGVGFLVLAVTTAAGLDLVRGNAVKVLSILGVTVLSLAIFAYSGRVDWWIGLVLGTGTIAGSQIGVRLTVLKGDRWLRAVVTAAVIVFAIKLWIAP